MKILDNYKQDLIKSIKTPLLIELNKKDLEQFDGNGLNKAALYAEYIYNEFISNKESTNLIFIDSNNYLVDNKNEKQSIILLEEIIKLTSKQIQSYKNINIAKSGVKSALSYFTGPLIKEIIGDYVDAGIDQVNDLLSEQFKNFIDVVEKELNYNFTDKILSKITSKINGTLNQSISNILEEVTNKKLNLSSKSINELSKLSSQFNENLTPVKIFSLILHLILLTAINEKDDQFNNKLIFINNPHKLDNESLAILSLLFSFSKDLKENNKHTGISVVYCYSDEQFQPYQELKDDQYKISKKLLDEQRRFTQRYAMLERPSSDIPNIAVKSSTFIGREKELQILKEQFKKSKEDSNLKNIEIIKAEPGIGKTKLVKKHLEQIKESEENGKRIIQLTILNQVGHSSSNTGLTSLKDSILNEAKRLETLKVFEETVVDNLKKMVKSKAISYIENLIGVNNIIEIGTSVKDAYDLKNNTNTMLEESTKGINNKDKKTKEQQFEEIIEAILELKVLAYEGKAINPFPIIFFIDDIQWIDDESSEFILNYLTKYQNLNIHIIATQRASDTTTTLKNAQKEPIFNQFKISFLQQTGITTENIIDIERVTKLVVNIIELNGLNKENLTELISLTIDSENKNENKKQKDKILAQFIIKNLVNENSEDKEYVNTLFAIETINMLCDEKLYSSNINITEQFILQNPLRYNESVKEFLKVLEDTFKILNNKYNDAFEHINSDKRFEQQFNLMAYAVLEERLYILHEYFREYGNAAVNTLLFSSLLGAPFNSEIVKNILFKLSNTEEELLQPLKDYINESQQCNLNEIHYEIIEEVYEILSRYIPIDSAYRYKHNLLEIFLDKQLDYILDSKLEKETIIEAKDSLFILIQIIIREEEKQQSFFNKNTEILNIKQYQNLLFFKQLYYKLFERGYKQNKLNWVIKYLTNLHDLSSLFLDINQPKKAMKFAEESFSMATSLFRENKLDAIYHVRSLNNLGTVYEHMDNFKEAIKYYEDAKELSEFYYKKEQKSWKEDYVVSLSNLATLYYKTDEISSAINIAKEILDYTKLHKEDSISFTKHYLVALNNLAIFYNELSKNDDAIKHAEKALEIIEDNYRRDKEEWTKDYVQSLITLGALYQTNEQIDDAFIKVKIALDITENLFDNNEAIWGKEYLMVLRNLASLYLYDDIKEVKSAINVYKKSLVKIEALFEKDNDTWIKDYITNLKGLAHSYIEDDEDDDAIEQLKIAFKIINKRFYNYPKVWSTDYIIILENLISLYLENYYIEEALPLVDEVINIKKILLKQSPANWNQPYFNTLYKLAIFYKENDKFDYAIYLGKEAYILSKKFYNENLIEVQTHVKCLVDFASIYTNSSFVDEVQLLNEALEIIEKQLKSNSIDWEGYHIKVLNILAESYENNFEFFKAIEITEKALNILKKSEGRYTVANYKWQLNKLGTLYANNGKVDAAINIFLELCQVIDKYDKNQVEWFNDFLETIDKLIPLFKSKNQIDSVIFWELQAIELIEEAYNLDPTNWGEYYKIRLHNLASVYRQNNQLKEALEQENKILNIK